MALPIRSRPFFLGTQVLGLTAIIFVLIWTTNFRGGLSWGNKDLVFNFHPFFMLLGFVVLNGEGIMLLRAYPLTDMNERHKSHVLAHSIAFLIGIYGLVAVFKSQKESNIANFHSLHSWIGIGIFVLYGILFAYRLTVFFFPELIPVTDYQGRIHGLLRSNGPFDTNEQGRMYGFLRFLIPGGTGILEDLHEPAPIRGKMRFFTPRGGFSARNNQKEQIAGDLRFFEPNDELLDRNNEQGRMYGTSRFFDSGGILEPVNKELMIDSLDSFRGTLELTRGLLPWHSLFGMVVYIGVVGNAALGFLQKLTILENSAAAAAKVVPKYGSEAYLVNSTAIITVLFGVFVIFTLLGDPITIRIETSINQPPQDPRSRVNTPETNTDSNVSPC